MSSTSYRKHLYEIFIDGEDIVETNIDRALQLGTEYLDLSIGFFTRIDQGTQEIIQAVGDHPLIQPGGTCPLDEAYCRRTIELDSPLAVQDANASSAISETAIETFDLGTYIGAKLTVNNEPYGTICFADKEERGTTFSDAETHFVELLAHLAGNAIERRTYEQELEERETRLDEREEEQRALIDASFDLVFRIDTDGQFTFISDTAEDLLGYTPEELVDRPFSLLLPDNASVELATETYEQALAGQSVEEEYLVVEERVIESVS